MTPRDTRKGSLMIPNMQGVRIESVLFNRRTDKKDKDGQKTGVQNAVVTIESSHIKTWGGKASITIDSAEVFAGLANADPAGFARYLTTLVAQNRKWRMTFAPDTASTGSGTSAADRLGDPEGETDAPARGPRGGTRKGRRGQTLTT